MKSSERIAEFRHAVDRLAEALALSEGNPLGVDASIQRFEFCVELAWKSLREVLQRDHGIETASPKITLQESYRVALISDEAAWLAMLRAHNLSSHTYRETLARGLYSRLPAYVGVLKRLALTLE